MPIHILDKDSIRKIKGEKLEMDSGVAQLLEPRSATMASGFGPTFIDVEYWILCDSSEERDNLNNFIKEHFPHLALECYDKETKNILIVTMRDYNHLRAENQKFNPLLMRIKKKFSEQTFSTLVETFLLRFENKYKEKIGKISEFFVEQSRSPMLLDIVKWANGNAKFQTIYTSSGKEIADIASKSLDILKKMGLTPEDPSEKICLIDVYTKHLSLQKISIGSAIFANSIPPDGNFEIGRLVYKFLTKAAQEEYDNMHNFVCKRKENKNSLFNKAHSAATDPCALDDTIDPVPKANESCSCSIQ
jgi:hypothetical protein